MRVNRRFLYWGVFLVAIGGVLVVADLGRVEPATITDALRLWPLAIVAIGLGLVLRRTRFSLAGGMLAAAAPGLLIGGGFALAPQVGVDCRPDLTPTNVANYDGVFDGTARVNVSTGCGVLVVDTAPGGSWTFEAGTSRGRPPIVESSGRSLSIDAGGRAGWQIFDESHDSWRLTLPTSAIDDLSFAVNAGEGRIDLRGAEIGHLDVVTNAAETNVDLTGTSIASVSGEVNAGKLTVRLPEAADLTGSMVVNAGALTVCVPDGVGLRLQHSGALSGVVVDGQQEGGPSWQSPNYASATHRADLNVIVNLGGVEINTIGACK
jgi:hypothetical protein